ncbi:hypothetical protein AB6A40_010146 [Gnathostoma spinigerum]|uniref:Uncharacterized protein n=1 Tax=Gnathostoma spinigerum TaxID=75299 RepID=A0ABD6F267_9BILA
MGNICNDIYTQLVKLFTDMQQPKFREIQRLMLPVVAKSEKFRDEDKGSGNIGIMVEVVASDGKLWKKKVTDPLETVQQDSDVQGMRSQGNKQPSPIYLFVHIANCSQSSSEIDLASITSG